MKRFVAAGGALIAAIGGILWFLLLMSTAADTVFFSQNYPLLIALNVVLAVAMLALVGWQLRSLWRDYQAQVFGSRLKLRLMLMFGVIAVLPGALVYGVSVQFVTRSIESWFDVRVEKALESGLQLGRSALDSRLQELTGKAREVALELSDIQESSRRSALLRLREDKGLQSAALFSVGGQLLSSATSELGLPDLPGPALLKQARNTRGVSSIEGEGSALSLRVLVPVPGLAVFEEPRILQVIEDVPATLAHDAEAVQDVYRDYQELQLARTGLTRIYALTLTLTVLVALFSAFALAYLMARRLAAPLYILAEGTQAVAQGDFSPRQAVYSGDELGVLTQSFNRMTRQLDDARRETERHRAELEAARGYLESILANLSTGVLVFDRRFVLRTVNEGALTILDDDFAGLVGAAVDEWPRQHALGEFIRGHFADGEEAEWQAQLELERPNGMPQVLLLRGSRLPAASGGGDVVVFDDVTRLIAAQRSAAWGEVARRLAHEIKNPLTPIQLSAERLQFKLADKLGNGDAEMLQRGTQTIIKQVQAMKRMVDDFRDYARMPAPEVAPLDLNGLIAEVLGLYESSSVAIAPELAPELPPVLGDATQIRQIIHNLLRNSEDALEGRPDARIAIRTAVGSRFARLVIADNGPGFPPELLPRIFEPYVTTKARGTGLGLPIVKKIVEEHLGTIEISNAPEGGARIDIRLPLVKEEEAKHGNHSGR
ncbi:ATP-binding protein [Azonexus sp.]|jgi:nitrogen fixation/metabolism regulation signal transduction histidine kinase|uniref:sensor histidine kinase n=1 Tax=Azonexus sp. TaxID=1872668 RepID=UPI0035B26324